MQQHEFNKLFPEGIKQGLTIPFVHKGKWAVHEILPFLLSHIGKAQVRIATFNISEDSLRPLFFHIEKQEIIQLSLLLDMNVKRHKLDLLLFAANITTQVRLSSTHMKLMLIQNGQWKIGITGSANLNRNQRYESGFIFTDTNLYDYFFTQYEEIFNNDSLPFIWN